MASQERYKLFFINGSFILILAVGCVLSKNQTCVAGLLTPGYTYPPGDITLEQGDDLDILCVLHESKAALYGDNPSSLMSIEWSKLVQPTDIVNSTAIRLHIENHPPVENAAYTCMINGSFVCHNVVVVGTKPKEVTDFTCIGHNFENFTCSWTEPENYVKTAYHLDYIPSSVRAAKFASRCPNITYKREGNKTRRYCTWSFSTTPQYRHSHPEFTFSLVAKNTFGIRTQKFNIRHYERVIPNAPENLTVVEKKPHSIKLKWGISVPMQSFPEPLFHRVMYWMSDKRSNWSEPIYINGTTNENVMTYTLENLPYAHHLYDIRVSMKSKTAKDENLWSENATITERTSSKIPDRPPNTNIGSFEIVNKSTRIIYWQKIDINEENGENFSYHIEVDGDPRIKISRNTKIKSSSNNFAKFDSLDDKNYTFKIWSKNEIGLSEKYSTVFVPASNYAVKPPEKLVKVDTGTENDIYELEWLPSYDQRVTNYTIFWCKAKTPYQCDGNLNWKTVPKHSTNLTLNLQDNTVEYSQQTFQFAVSANGPHTSSGMLWAGCTYIQGRGVKLAPVYVKNVNSRSITVAWKPECLKMSDIRGFNISYCQTESPRSFECKNNSVHFKAIRDPMAEQGIIENLKPYTRYMLKVKVLLNNTEGIFSEPMVNSTFEDLPSVPRYLKVLDVSNSSIKIQWEEPLEKNGYIRHYKLSVDDVEFDKILPAKEETVFVKNITNLIGYTDYKISVAACTKDCGKESSIQATTEAGHPGHISKPSGNWENSTIVVKWGKPVPAAGRVDYYEVWVSNSNKEHEFAYEKDELRNVTDPKYIYNSCGNDKSRSVYIRVRAVNIFAGKQLKGPWSELADFPCFATSNTWVIIIVVMAVFVFIGLIIYLVKKLWFQVVRMRNVPVKLPDGLAAVVDNLPNYQEKDKHADDSLPADEPLLQKKFPSQQRNLSGESSGCSSGHESVASSMESGGHLSLTDSGTEQPRSPSLGDAENRDVELRQRNKPNVKKTSDYVTVSELPQASWTPKPTPSGYSVIGMIPPTKKPEMESEYMALSDITPKSSYVPFSVSQSPEPIKETSCRPPNSGYVPYMPQEPASKNTDYVLAGVPTKPAVSKGSFAPKDEVSSSGYVMVPPMEAPKTILQFPWQQQSPVEPNSTGYVVVGDTKPPKLT